MPRGVYPRTANQLKAAKINLAKGHSKESREKATAALRKNAADPEWRAMVAKVTKDALNDPEIRQRHLDGIRRSQQKHGINFRGGNGQEPIPLVRTLEPIFGPMGFVRECVILTRDYDGPEIKLPNSYKVDFGNKETKVAIELDGPAHDSPDKREKDRKKQAVLTFLGWTVLRLKHK